MTLLIVAMVLVVLAPFFLQSVIVPLVGVLLIVPAMLKLVAAVVLASPHREYPDLLSDEDLPIYTVLIPLRDEARMVPQLRRAMEALDYPREKLQVLFVVEEKSAETVRGGGSAARRSTV